MEAFLLTVGIITAIIVFTSLTEKLGAKTKEEEAEEAKRTKRWIEKAEDEAMAKEIRIPDEHLQDAAIRIAELNLIVTHNNPWVTDHQAYDVVIQMVRNHQNALPEKQRRYTLGE